MALILTIAFVVVVGVISGGLASIVTSSSTNRGPLEALRNRQYAADGAIEFAIARVRLASVPTLADADSPLPPMTACNQVVAGGSLTSDGLPTGMPILNGVAIRVEWENACGAITGPDGVVVQRNVIFSACLASASPCAHSGAVIVRAQVNFQQNPTDAVAMTFIQTWSVNG